MLFPIFGAHMSGVKFQYPGQNWKEPCRLTANLVAESGGNKGQLPNLEEALCHDFPTHDEMEPKKLVERQHQVKTLSLNKEKPNRPEAALYFPPAETSSRQPSKSP